MEGEKSVTSLLPYALAKLSPKVQWLRWQLHSTMVRWFNVKGKYSVRTLHTPSSKFDQVNIEWHAQWKIFVPHPKHRWQDGHMDAQSKIWLIPFGWHYARQKLSSSELSWECTPFKHHESMEQYSLPIHQSVGLYFHAHLNLEWRNITPLHQHSIPACSKDGNSYVKEF